MGNKAHILLVDDSSHILMSLEQMLIIFGFQITTATNGREAQDKLVKGKFDLLITDINMPVVNGFELVKFVRKQNIKLPVIFITADAGEEDKARADSLGAAAILTKPIALDKLYATIDKALAMKF